MKAIAIFLIFFASQAAFAGFTCENVFVNETPAKEYALKLGIDENRDTVSKLLFKRYFKKWNPSFAYTTATFEKRIAESYDLLRKLQIRQGLIDNRGRDFHEKPEELIEWAETSLMKEGLKPYLLKMPADLSAANRLRYQIQRLLETKAMKTLWTSLTLNLPKRFDRSVPPDLLTQISIDGVDAHIDELQQAYNVTHQSKVDTYKRLRKAIGYMVLTVNALMMFHHLELSEKQQQLAAEQLRIEQAQQFNQMNQQLDQLEAMIDAI